MERRRARELAWGEEGRGDELDDDEDEDEEDEDEDDLDTDGSYLDSVIDSIIDAGTTGGTCAGAGAAASGALATRSSHIRGPNRYPSAVSRRKFALNRPGCSGTITSIEIWTI